MALPWYQKSAYWTNRYSRSACKGGWTLTRIREYAQ
jgi:hypothetical protein